MKRFRPLVLLGPVLGLLASLLTATPAAAAVNSFHAWITCDPVTNTITTGVTGLYGVQPNLAVTVDFKVETGYYATATTSASIPAKGSVTTVVGRSAANGDLTVSGYTRSFPISNYLFYTEKVSATVKNTSGGILATRTATCDYDLRTIATLTCDRDAQTITARVEGSQFNEPQPMGLRIQYERSILFQSSATDPAFRLTRYTAATHTVTPVNGTITDTGWSNPQTTDPYYYEETVWATISSPYTGRTLGRATATCIYSDHRTD
ncbi:MAG TPA: hypothetical protein VFT31_15515 [Kribbella sp.]|nr:hypothetical protein [Kribbella sp.]